MDIDFAYAPVIKGKLNDIKAISYIAHGLADRIKPVFELPPFIETDKPEQVLARFAARLSKLYPTRPCYIDFPLLKAGARTSQGDLVLSVAYGQLNALSLNYEPVYGFDRDDALWGTVIQQAKRSGGMLLRLGLDDLEFASDTFDQIQDLTLRGLDTTKMDVLLDCRSLSDIASTVAASEMASIFIDNLATSFRVRKIIVAGSSALKTVTSIEKNSRGDVLRNELSLWANIRVRNLPLDAIYSDYGVIHPDFTDLTPSPHINGKIRYTQGRHFHVFRGHSLSQDDKYEQYRKLSHSVLTSGFFQGHKYSHGDRYIYDCATGQTSTGNAGTWVMNDLNHHFTYAAQQIQRLETFIYRGYSEQAVLELA
jgi:hypothetical protein